MKTVHQAANDMLLAIERGEPFDVLDNVYAPALREALTNDPRKRKTVGPLSDEEIDNLRHIIDPTADWSYSAFARAIERAHGIGDINA